MNYSAVYDRGALKVVHPQLEANVAEQRAGRKRFEVHKNEESSGLSYGYGMNHAQKKSFNEDTSQGYPARAEPPNEFYKASPYKQLDYKSTNSYREQPGGSYNSNSYNQGNPGYGAANGGQGYGNAGGGSFNPGPSGNLNREPPGKYLDQGKNQYDEGMYEGYEEKYTNEGNYYRDKASGQYDEPKYPQSINNQADYPRQSEDPPAPQTEDPKPGDYYDEIEKLKEELRRKEQELASYSQTLSKTPPKPVESQEAMYSRINKAMFDKQRTEEQRKVNSSTLDYQLNEKNRMKSLYQQEKEREQAVRLEMLRKLKEDEAYERMEKQRRAKEYREQLEVQNLVKSNIKNQERMFYKNDLPKSFEAPPQQYYEPVSRSNNSSNNLGYSPASFTKKTPKTICYNPITGVLKDTSQFVYGSFPSYNVKDPSITYLKNQSNIPELAAHPAFQQVKFTKNHPKVVPSFPITGNPLTGSPNEARDDDPDAYKNQEGRMAEYGQLMMKNS